MKQSDAYNQFFVKNEHGQEFVKWVNTELTTAHEKAEKDPDHARDYTMEAKAYREILNHIQSVTTARRVKNLE